MSSLIVLDGLDGSGKTTQFERLLKENEGFFGISFPEYDKPSAVLVKMYLSGEFSSNAADVNAYAASTFYAADRYASYKLYWEKTYKAGIPVLASRYVCSNIIHQMPKLPEDEWDGFIQWLEDYEYDKLGLPRPDKVLLLDIPVWLSQKRLLNRYHGDSSKRDIHESDTTYMEHCRKAALYAANKCGWCVIPSVDGDKELSADEVYDLITKEIQL
ncbi:MAG: thymidylate kinase [Oscillospiraceae bacterium]|nr:thymidylate kinase [Oscillospiraceae bacterium]